MSNSFRFLLEIVSDFGLSIEVLENNLIVVESKTILILKEIENSAQIDSILLNIKHQNLRIIYIWEDELLTKPILIKARLSSILGLNRKIPARLCYVKRLTKEHGVAFLEENHLQGYVKSKFKYGLFLKQNYKERFDFSLNDTEVLLAVSTFSGARNFKKNEQIIRSYELIRFASLSYLNVVGGFDKLISHFKSEQHPDHLMTYVDAEWSDAKGYCNLGFSINEKTKPISFLINKETFLRRKMEVNFDKESETLVENMGNWKLEKYF